mmetsp:Transcript_31214/g.42285  ORF Transcript_31214/g.42285 Transcript_31214/m.42285 type:complete len:289 (-) Transcript_31214:33-899(-)
MYKDSGPISLQQMLLLGTLNLPPIVELIENTALVANHNLLLQALFESSDTLYGIMTGTLDRKMGLPTPIEEGVRTTPGLLHGMQDGAVMSIAQKLSHASRTVSAYGSYDGSPQWANRILWRNLDFLQPPFEAVCSDQKQSSLPMRALLSLPCPVRQRDEISSERLNSGLWAIPRSFLGPEESRMLLESFLSGKERRVVPEKARLEAEEAKMARVKAEAAEKARVEAEVAENANVNLQRMEESIIVDHLAKKDAEKARFELYAAEFARVRAEEEEMAQDFLELESMGLL